jgi:hypothetical protein
LIDSYPGTTTLVSMENNVQYVERYSVTKEEEEESKLDKSLFLHFKYICIHIYFLIVFVFAFINDFHNIGIFVIAV